MNRGSFGFKSFYYVFKKNKGKEERYIFEYGVKD